MRLEAIYEQDLLDGSLIVRPGRSNHAVQPVDVSAQVNVCRLRHWRGGWKGRRLPTPC